MHHHPSFGGPEFLYKQQNETLETFNEYNDNNVNAFNTEQKSENKQRVLLGSKLRELFMISKDEKSDVIPNST